jgi:hypothetical protein
MVMMWPEGTPFDERISYAWQTEGGEEVATRGEKEGRGRKRD